jgi:hypothetical protein
MDSCEYCNERSGFVKDGEILCQSDEWLPLLKELVGPADIVIYFTRW